MQGTHDGADVALASLQQQLAGVTAQLRAVDADIQAARAAGDVDEVKALREKEKVVLMEKENLLLRERNLLRGLDVDLQPGVCLLAASHRLAACSPHATEAPRLAPGLRQPLLP